MNEQELKEYIDQQLPDLNRNRAAKLRLVLKTIIDNLISPVDLEDLDLVQENTPKIIDLGGIITPQVDVPSILLNKAVTIINNLPENGTDYKTVGNTELILFRCLWVVRRSDVRVTYITNPGPGMGEYGENGDLVINNDTELELLSWYPNKTLDHIASEVNAYTEHLGEIVDGDYLSVINSASPSYIITNPQINWYFEFTQGGDKVILYFQGTLGTYGNVDDSMVSDDLVIIYDERVEAALDIISLTGDGVDNTDPENPVMDLSNWQQISEKGVANGYAGLDGSGKVPAAQLPSYVDDVLEFTDLASFPVTGETGKIYIALDTGKTYRWSGSAYVEISSPDIPTENQIKGTAQLELTAKGAITATFNTHSMLYINQTGNVTLSVRLPKLDIGEKVTRLIWVKPNGNTFGLPTELTDTMSGKVDVAKTNWIAVTYVRIGSTIVQFSNCTSL